MKKENKREDKHEMNGVTPGGDAELIQKRIALRAYELYLQRGGVDGHEVEDWLEAERELVQAKRH